MAAGNKIHRRICMLRGMHFSRRDWCLALPALAASAAQASEKTKLPSRVYSFKDLKASSQPGFTAREVFQGYTHGGCRIAMHESKLDAGAIPHPPHHHQHEEIFMPREGTLEVTIGGKTSKVGPGDVAYVASNEEHGVRNVGSTSAQYFVLELGADQ
jgi:mannose-6-phosphate isomerase-like protein (cupin superfamily)